MQVLIAISGFCGFCSRIGNTPCTTPFDFLFVISIHVPAWGTTADVSKTDSTFQKDFNPRSRVGNDLNMRADDDGFIDFNPRSRVGNDKDMKKTINLLNISIHVPAWGPTGRKWHRLVARLFQSTFPRGERLFFLIPQSHSL